MLWSVTSADVDLSSQPAKQQVADSVGHLIHAYVEIIEVQQIREETITKEGFNVSVVETGLPSFR